MEPLAQVEVEAELRRFGDLVEKQVSEHARRLRAYYDTDRDYDVAFSVAMLTAKRSAEKVTDGVAHAEAVIATEADRAKRDAAKARLDASAEAGRNYREILQSLRSLNANLRGIVGA